MNNLQETVTKADKRIRAELSEYIPKKAIGFLKLIVDNEPFERFILINAMTNTRERSAFGRVSLEQGRKAHLGGVSKNAPMVRMILSKEDFGAQREIMLPNGKTATIHSRAEYIPNANDPKLQNGFIDSIGNEIFNFNDCMASEFEEIFNKEAAILKVEEEIKKIEKAKAIAEVEITDENIEKVEHAALELEKEKLRQEKIEAQNEMLSIKIQEREKLESEKLQRVNNLYRYRRTKKTLKQIVSLKGKQDDALVNNLLQGALIINGGPGTGKTTVLIHKLQFLKDHDRETNKLIIEETPGFDLNLTDKDRALILDPNKGWIFFSPTELLRSFLKDSMAAEGLTANQESVRVWNIHKTQLMKSFDFFNSENPKFLKSKHTEDLLNPNAKKLKEILKSFSIFHLNSKIKYIQDRADLKLNEDLLWLDEGKEIQKSLNEYLVKPSIESFVRLFNKFKRKRDFIDLAKMIDEDYNETIDKASKNIVTNLSKEEIGQIIEILKHRWKKRIALDNKEVDITDVLSTIKTILRSDALSTIDKKTKKVATANKEIYHICESHIEKIKDKYYSVIAQNSLFRKYFKPLLRGPERLLIDDIPTKYKEFRKEFLLKEKWLLKDQKKVLEKVILEEPRNIRIHEDEMDLLLLIMMSSIRKVYDISVPTFEKSTNKYIVAYKDHAKAIVAVDEATDFTLVQLSCMAQIAHPRFNCIVLVGDAMQKLEGRGIENWDEFVNIYPKTHRENLNVSYRQTPKLLDLASKLHEHHFGVKPEYVAKAKTDGQEPSPLVFVDNDLDNQVQWLSDRILELHDIYDGVIPNIAIFAKDDHEVESVTEKLKNNSNLYDKNINTQACIGRETLGNAENIRVFNIERIKGLEFEAVFFLNIDTYKGEDQTLLDRYIYVGISRASVFLGITLKSEFPASLSCIENDFEKGTWRNSDDLINDSNFTDTEENESFEDEAFDEDEELEEYDD